MFVADQLSLRLVPDELWALAELLIPKFRPRPQGGGTAPLDDRAVLDELGARGELDWASVIIDAASVRAKKGGR